MENQDNYKQQLEKWVEEFKNNGEEIVMHHGCYPILEGHSVIVPYFQKNYCVDFITGRIYPENAGDTLDTMSHMMIYSYLSCLKKEAKPSGTMVSLQGIKKSAVFDAAFRRNPTKELVDSVADKLELFEKKVRAYGGFIEDSGDFAVSFFAFPEVKITYVFWIGDDEFESNINILFDLNITEFVHPESVVILGGHGLTVLQKIAKDIFH